MSRDRAVTADPTTSPQDEEEVEVDVEVDDAATDTTAAPADHSGSPWSSTRVHVLVAAVLVLGLVAGGASWWLGRGDDLGEGVALRVDGTTITEDELDDRVDALVALYGVRVPTDDEGLDTFRRDAAKSMAVQVMLEAEAADRDIVVADKEVSDTLSAIVDERYAEGGRSAFVAALGEMGATEDQVRSEIRHQLLVSRVFDQVVAGVGVSDDELRTVFDEREDELGTPVRRVLRNAVVADRSTAVRIVKQFRSGVAFAVLAEQLSLDEATRLKGGYLGPVAASDLEKGYAEAAFTADVGDTTGPVRTQYGWNVGFVQAEVPARPATYAQVRDALRETVLAERSLGVWRDWLGEIIAEHPVDYAVDYEPDDPGAVPDIDEVAPTSAEAGP